MKKNFVYACLALLILAGCARASSNTDNDMKLSIYHYKMPGAGENVQLCYVIKTASGEKEFFYSEIQGFKFQWGYNYVILVEKKNVGTAKADASTIIYRLKEIIKKEKVAPNEQFELPVNFNDQVLVENNKGACTYFQDISIQAAAGSCAALAKAQSAIFKYNADMTRLVLVKVK